MIKTGLDLNSNPYGLVDARIGDLFAKLDIIISLKDNIESISGVFSPEYLADLEKTIDATKVLATNFQVTVDEVEAAIATIESTIADVAANTSKVEAVQASLAENATSLADNKTAIENAVTSIGVNATGVANNLAAIGLNSTAITAIQNIDLYDNEEMQTHLERYASIKEVYVSQQGDDTNNGLVLSSAVRSLKHALSLVADGGVINVGVGTFTEAYPLVVPRNVSIVGGGLRVTSIKPTDATKSNDVFKVDSGAYLTCMAFVNHQAGSFAVSFNELADNTAIGASGIGAHIFKSPYVQNCTSFTAQDDGGVAGSLSDGSTGGGMLIDGASCSPNSPIRSMVVDSFTQINLDGPGCLVTNNAYAQLVSFFGTFCSYHVKAEKGGQVNLSNSTTDFGVQGLVAIGKSPTAIYSGDSKLSDADENTLGVVNLSASTIGLSNRPAEGQVFVVGGETYTITGAVEIVDGYQVTFYPYLINPVADAEEVLFYQRSQISTSGHTMEFVGAGTNYLALPFNGGQSIPGNEVVEEGDGRVFYSTTDQLGTFRVGKQFSVNGTTGEVTISTDSFNLSGLNAIGPFSRDGGQTAVGSQLLEFSNNLELVSSTGVSDANTAPSQYAVAQFLLSNYTKSEDFADVANSGSYADLIDLPTLGTAAATDANAYATADQGATADSAIQPSDLDPVATSGAYNDLSGKPSLGTAAQTDADAYGTAAQGEKADSATQAGDLAVVATSGSYSDLANKPEAGTDGSYATAAQGVKADSAVQPADQSTVASSGAYSDLSGVPTLGSAAAADTADFATASQGSLADSALQPADISTVATTGSYDDLSATPTLAPIASSGSYDDLADVPVTHTENSVTLASAPSATNIDLNLANVFCVEGSFSSPTFTFINIPSSPKAIGFTLKLYPSNTSTVTFPASVKWAGGEVPDAPELGTTNTYTFFTEDGGTSWYGFLTGKDMS